MIDTNRCKVRLSGASRIGWVRILCNETIRTEGTGMGQTIKITHLDHSASDLRAMAAKSRDGGQV